MRRRSGITSALPALLWIVLPLAHVSPSGAAEPVVRPALDGEPIVIVQDGQVIEKNIRRERLTAAEILVEARCQQVASMDEIAWAVLETNGKISIIPKKSSP